MLTKKEKVISFILCVISVILLIASLCFTSLLFTTHGTTMKAEAAVDITSDQYAQYFSEEIFPNGHTLSIDETYFGSYSSSLGGYSAQVDLDNQTYTPLRLDIAYRCYITLIDDEDTLYDESAVFFPSAYNTDGTLYWGFCFNVETAYVIFRFNEPYIKVDILCDSDYYVDTFFLSEVPSLTISSFYSSYEILDMEDGWGANSTSFANTGSLDCFYGEYLLPYDFVNYPCFFMLQSNVGNLLVFFNPYIVYDTLYGDLACFRVVGIPNNFYTYCQYNDYSSQEAFIVLSNDCFDDDFVFSFNDVYLVAPVPLNQSSGNDDPSINESLGEVILQGMTFGFDSIGEGISYTVNNLFFDEEGKLSTFTYVIVFTLGIGIVLGFIKWLLSYILSLGGKD